MIEANATSANAADAAGDDFGPCPTCDGRGWVKCPHCDGTGHHGYCRVGGATQPAPCPTCWEGEAECPFCGGPETVEVPLDD